MTWSFVKYLEHSECSISGTIFTVEIPKSIEWESGRESNTLEIPKAHTTANPLKSYLSRNIGELRSRKALGHECHCYADGVTSFSNPEDWRFDFCFWFYSFILSFSSIFFFLADASMPFQPFPSIDPVSLKPHHLVTSRWWLKYWRWRKGKVER